MIETGYRLAYISENGIWSIGLFPVLFGMRVVAWRTGSSCRSVDYCAGNDVGFAIDLLDAIKRIFEGIPEDIQERGIEKMMPQWEIRPTNNDPCWPALQRLAVELNPND